MAYDWTPKQIERVPFDVAYAIYREKYLHQVDQTAHWKAKYEWAKKQVGE